MKPSFLYPALATSLPVSREESGETLVSALWALNSTFREQCSSETQ